MFRQMFEEKYMRFTCGKSKAVTFSYDDGVKADARLIEIFNRYGMKAAFNLNSELFDCENWHGRMDEEQTYKTFANCGHEIAMHGARHVFMNKVPLPEAINEVVKNRAYLERKFDRTVRGMAYAYNGYNDEIISALKALGVIYARTTESTHAFSLPENFLKLHPTCHHGDACLKELEEKFLKENPEDEFKHRESRLFYIWGHSYEFDDNANWHVIESLCKDLAGRKDIWFATSAQIAEYVAAYKNLVFSLDGERAFNPAYMPVYLEIRGEVYEIGAGREVVFKK